MERLDKLRSNVEDLYSRKNADRADWADWLFANHVFIVADNARKLALKYGANVELSEAAAILHDIADSQMKREDPNHEQASLDLARKLMQESGYDESEIKIVVDDAIRLHGCHDGNRPESKEGLVLATADSLAHLKTDFYVYATHVMGTDKTLDEVKQYVLKKIDRDLNNKICFEDERNNSLAYYELIKNLFSR